MGLQVHSNWTRFCDKKIKINSFGVEQEQMSTNYTMCTNRCLSAIVVKDKTCAHDPSNTSRRATGRIPQKAFPFGGLAFLLKNKSVSVFLLYCLSVGSASYSEEFITFLSIFIALDIEG